MSLGEIAKRLGVAKPTVCYHKRRLGYPMNERFACRYDWDAIQDFYDAGHSVRECEKQFGFSTWAWSYAVKRGAVVPRPQARPLSELLVAKKKRSRHTLKRRLLAAGLKTSECEECGISEWQDQPLSLSLHHINGDGNDNRLENLALLCPNCHSQTPNFGTRNWKERRANLRLVPDRGAG